MSWEEITGPQADKIIERAMLREARRSVPTCAGCGTTIQKNTPFVHKPTDRITSRIVERSRDRVLCYTGREIRFYHRACEGMRHCHRCQTTENMHEVEHDPDLCVECHETWHGVTQPTLRNIYRFSNLAPYTVFPCHLCDPDWERRVWPNLLDDEVFTKPAGKNREPMEHGTDHAWRTCAITCAEPDDCYVDGVCDDPQIAA